MRSFVLFAKALAFWLCLQVAALGLFAQAPQAEQKIANIARALKLTPQQKIELVPILKAEAPKIEAIKSNPSLSSVQKVEELRAIHAETEPQVRAILTPQQYQQLQGIREREIQEAVKRKLNK